MVEIDPIQVRLTMLTIVGPAITGIILAWVKSKTKCLSKIDKRSFRQSKALIVMAQEIDRQANYAHHKNQKSDLSETIEELLKDEKGNL